MVDKYSHFREMASLNLVVIFFASHPSDTVTILVGR